MISAGRSRSSSVCKRGIIFQFCRHKIAGGQVHQRQAEDFSARTDGGEEIVSLGHEHAFVEMRAGREDLRDLAFDEFAGPGVFKLIANGDFASGLEDSTDVSVGRMMRNAAHGHAVARW